MFGATEEGSAIESGRRQKPRRTLKGGLRAPEEVQQKLQDKKGKLQ